MNKATKIWLIIAASSVLLGLIMFAGVMTVLKWDFTKLSTTKYETNTYSVAEDFSSISINTDTADIVFLPSDDGKCKIVAVEDKNEKHSVSVKDGTLNIELVNTKKWYQYIGINFVTPKLTVYLPEAEYASLTVKLSTGDVSIPKEYKFDSIDIKASTGDISCLASASGNIKIKTSTGKINVENLSADSLDLEASTGSITVKGVQCGNIKQRITTGKTAFTDVTCKDLTSRGDTGDITLSGVIAAGKFSIERSTGNVKFDKCDASEIFVLTDTGDVTGTLLSEKIFFPKTDTGKIDVPKTMSGGRCEITTDTGNIKINID